MKIDIHAAEGIVLEEVEIPGNSITAKESMTSWLDKIQAIGFYVYESPRSARVNIIPYHAITSIEQSDMTHKIVTNDES